MRTVITIIYIVFFFLLFPTTLYAQNIYELRKLTDEDWIGMSTEERLTALGISNSQARNQTFLGSFGGHFIGRKLHQLKYTKLYRQSKAL